MLEVIIFLGHLTLGMAGELCVEVESRVAAHLVQVESMEYLELEGRVVTLVTEGGHFTTE